MPLFNSKIQRNSNRPAANQQHDQPFFGVQTKLNIGKAGDSYEREADAVADRVVEKQSASQEFSGPKPFFEPRSRPSAPVQAMVNSDSETQEIQEKPISESISSLVQMSTPAPPAEDDSNETQNVQTPCAKCGEESENASGHEAIQTFQGDASPLIQTKCAECESKEQRHIQTKCAECERKEQEHIQSKSLGADTPVQLKCDKCAKEEAANIQAKSNSNGSPQTQRIESQLHQSRGGGTQMDSNTRTNMERGFGSDFSNVRIHTGDNAVQMNRSLGSHAFANGNNIYFNQGKYDPNSKGGKTLLAHELTHTIQQGASPKGVQQKEEDPNVEPVQMQADPFVQMEGDPCAEPDETGSSAESSAAETAPTDPNCATRDLSVEQPSEDQEEPEGEDSARDIEANEGGPVDERQSHAPPADENAPEGDENIGEDAAVGAEQSMDPCALREQSGAEGAVEVGGEQGANPAPAAEAPAAGAAETGGGAAAGAEQGGEVAATDAPQEGDQNFMAAAIGQVAGSLSIAAGLGEEASPELRDERDAERNIVEEQLARASTTQESVAQIASEGATYKAPKKGKRNKSIQQNHAQVSAMASSFLSSGAEQVNSILSSGMTSASQIRTDTEGKKAQLSEEISMKRASIFAFYANATASAQAKADSAKLTVAGQHSATLAQIETAATSAAAVIQQTFDAKTLELQEGYDAQLLALDQAYSDGHAKLIATGARMGNAAEAFGSAKAGEYRGDAVYEYEGFWDGYITYNRQMARVDAAQETGEQYKEGMISQAEAQAEQMMCGKTQDAELLGVMLQQGNETLMCAYLNGMDAVARQRQAAIMQATYTQEELVSNIDQSLSATLAQFEEKRSSQLQLVNDYGIRQGMAIEKGAEKAIASAMEGINTAVDQLVNFLKNYQSTIKGSEAPDMVSFQLGQTQIQEDFSASVAACNEAITSTIETAQLSLDEGFAQALTALNELYSQGISDGRMLANSFNSTIDSLLISASTTYAQLQANALQTIASEQENATMTLTAVAAGVLGLMTNTVSGVGSKFTEADTAMAEGMQSTIDSELDAKICSEAEKAAAEVKPWWKTALKILLIIVVIVVVALVIGPAVIGAVGAAASALAGSLGAGAALAGTIGAWAGPIIGGAIVGALSGAVIQVGNNLIDIAGTDKELSWDNITEGVWGAMIAGAIGGALGGLGGQFAQVLMGRFGAALGPGLQAVTKFGIESAFDVVGGVLGDLAAGNPVTWESIVMGLAIGGAVQVSMGGLSAIARNGISAPHTDAGVSGPRLNPDGTPRTGFRSRVQDTARSIQDFQGRMMEAGQNFGNKAGFGSNAPSVGNTRQGIIDANTRMEGGEFFPTRDVETTTPRPDAEADINTPRTDGDGETTTPRTDADGENTTPRTEGDAETSRVDGEAENPRLNDPNSAPENNQITAGDITAERNWIDSNSGQRKPSKVEGYTEEIELPNGHTWRKNESGGWCRFSDPPSLLTTVPHEIFTMNLDILNLNDRYIVPGNIIHAQLMQAEQQLRARFQQSTSSSTQNRNVLSTRMGFVIQDASGNLRFIVFDPQMQFQSGLGIRTTTNTQIVPEIDPKVLGAYSTVQLPEEISNQLLSEDPTVRSEAERNARKYASSRARSTEGSIGGENARMGITSNTTGSLDFHSERTFYSWIRENPSLFADAIKNLGITDPVVKSVIIDMASTRYVCSRCAMAGTNLAVSGSELDFMSKIRAALDANLIGVDPDLSVKIRASAEVVFPINKIIPNLTEFADILRMNTGVPSVDFPLGTMDYDLLRVVMALQGGDNAAIQNSLNSLQQNKEFLFRQLSLESMREQLRLTSEVEGLRSLTPILCTL